jgi:chromosome segregation ATPase
MQPRPMQTVESSVFKSTYARLLVDFTKTFFNLKNISDDNPALKRSAVLYGKLSQMEQNLSSYADLSNVMGDINNVISTLQAIPTQKQNAAVFSQQRDEAAQKVKSSEVVRESLVTNFDELKKSVFAMIKVTLEAIDQLDKEKQREKSGSQEIDNQLKAGQISVTKYRTQLEKFLKDCRELSENLNKLHTSSWATVPTAHQTSLPTPSRSGPEFK